MEKSNTRLSLIHELLKNSKTPLPPEFLARQGKFDVMLGLGLLAVHTPHEWKPSHLPIAENYLLMASAVAVPDGADDPSAESFRIIGESMERLQPQEPIEKRLKHVETAYAVIGQRGSGKGTVLRFMEEEGVSTAPSSRGLRVVAQVLLQREATTPELVAMGKQFKEIFGFDVFIKMILSQMTALPEDMWHIIGIDGLRTQEEIDIFRQLFEKKAKVVAVVRPNIQTDEEGWAVVSARQIASGKVEYISFEDYVKTQQEERERIELLIQQADEIVINETDEEALKEKVHDLVVK